MLEQVFGGGGWVFQQNLPVTRVVRIRGRMAFLHPILLVARFDAVPEEDDTENSKYAGKQIGLAE